MVYIQSVLFKTLKKKIRHFRPGDFIDSLQIIVKGGHGGNGLPKYGGVGGQGGCVYFVAKEDATLRSLQQKYSQRQIFAGHGEDSSKLRLLGRRGIDEKVEVPLGITVLDEAGKVLGELDKENVTFLAAGGGSGGCAGNSFLGHKGQPRTLKLDLKLIADVGLVGFPNAGKSTFLKAVSNASPKIAAYPFTTIKPQIGIMNYQDYRQISVADLPGLIEGAHVNIGMGHKFLKHIERVRLLLLVVDIFGFQLSQKHIKRNCLENVYSLNKELEMYDKTLLDKPAILLVNKMDLDGSTAEFRRIENILNNLEDGLHECPEELSSDKLISFERVIPISAKNAKELEKAKNTIRDVLDLEAKKKLELEDDEPLQRMSKEIGPKVV